MTELERIMAVLDTCDPAADCAVGNDEIAWARETIVATFERFDSLLLGERNTVREYRRQRDEAWAALNTIADHLGVVHESPKIVAAVKARVPKEPNAPAWFVEAMSAAMADDKKKFLDRGPLDIARYRQMIRECDTGYISAETLAVVLDELELWKNYATCLQQFRASVERSRGNSRREDPDGR